MKPKFQPTNDRVLYEREMSETPKGLVVVNVKQQDEPTLFCKVLAVGPKVTLVRPGLRVIIPFNCGYPVEDIGLLCREHDILAYAP